ncbi:hypothetical protein D5S17_25700 [Pseudonocardiaceae bacterium YIM PH 21723]|nr:hypothetical protein D5S17_25700 [Pseudonocardiaceae bacterium YIM PH 21723]
MEQSPVPRRPFHRRTDYLVSALIVIVTLVIGLALWRVSDARSTVDQTTTETLPLASPLTTVPTGFAEAWRAASTATPVPVLAGAAVVTGDGHEVAGHEALTGRVVWRYSRNLDLCTVGLGWGDAIAIYRKKDTCSEVTQLAGDTGRRGPQRNGDSEVGTQLLSDGTFVATTGQKLIEVWRSPMIRTQQYGTLRALINPNRMPRPDCRFRSQALGSGRVAVIERCKGDDSDRLTQLKSDPSDGEKPEELFSAVLGQQNARVVATNQDRAAALLPGGRLQVFKAGEQPVTHQLTITANEQVPIAEDTTVGPVDAEGRPGTVYWHIGGKTIALDGTDFHPLWTADNTAGTGVLYAGKFLIPTAGGLRVVDQRTGVAEREISIVREGYTGPIVLRTNGSELFEQRGSTVVALKPKV